jgi:hypothetical protein
MVSKLGHYDSRIRCSVPDDIVNFILSWSESRWRWATMIMWRQNQMTEGRLIMCRVHMDGLPALYIYIYAQVDFLTHAMNRI